MRLFIVLIPLFLLLGACGDKPSGAGLFHDLPVERISDAEVLALGETVYQRHCMECHGAEAEGVPDWRKMDAEGRFPPPPLNGDGHSWHHPSMILKRVISDGGPKGRSNMPAWGEVLSKQEIEAVIAWFQAKWPDQAFEAWARMETEMREKERKLGISLR